MIGSANPFVGPRPFESGERLWGRDREIRELENLLSAERIVLLHSPSGAGKSSLVQAGLMPRLKKSFDVWGPTRLNQEPRDDLKVNRYVLSAVEGLEEGIPEKHRRPPEVLAGQTLREYADARPRRRSAPDNVLLVFDQFEEILTVDPLAIEAKREFFDQLGDLLRNPRVWALVALREDYLAPLDPYARQVPTHLKIRFRIDLLGLDGAREAMVNPAREGGREFPAAEQLVHDLATMKVQQADGSFREETGRHVEPVQLQVVCFRLWNEMPADDRSIDAEDLEQFGDVTEALAGYYADSVTALADGDDARSRAIRDWFGDALITAGGIRGQVLRGADESEGLANDVIEQFLDTHLVRAEKRAGATWYELAHDRLIEPVQNDNAAWRAEHLSEVQQRATLWERQGRPPGLLLRDVELAEAERWAAGAAVITAVEARFLEESRKAQDVADRERRQARRIKRLGIAALVVGALALVAGVVAVQQMVEAIGQRRIAVAKSDEAERERLRAEEQAEIAEQKRREAERERQRAEEEKKAADEARDEADVQRQAADEQKAIAETNEQRAREQEEAAVEARDEARRAQEIAVDEKKRAEEEKTRADVNARESDRLRLLAEAEAIAVRTTGMTEEPNREQAALLALQAYRLNQRSGGEEENTQIYNAMRLALKQLGSDRLRVLHGHQAEVRSLAVAPDGRTLVSGDENGEVRLIDLDQPDREPTIVGRLGAGARALAFSTSGQEVAGGSFDGTIQIWDLSRLAAAPRILSQAGAAIYALAFRPGSAQLAAGDAGGGIRLWDLAAAEPEAEFLLHGAEQSDAAIEDHREPPHVRSLAFRADGARLAAASYGRGVLVWDLVQGVREPRLMDEEPWVRTVAFSHDGHFLVAGTDQGPVVVWDPEQPGSGPTWLRGHTSRVESLEFHPHRHLLASGSFDGTLRLWDVRNPDALPLVLEGHDFWVWAAAFSPDGERLISGSGDRTIHLWTTSSEALAAEICRTVARNLSQQEWDEYLPPEVEYEKTCPHLPAAARP